MSSSAISYVSLPHSMALSVMTRTKPVRIVVKSAIANTIAQNSETSQLISYVASAVTLATWQRIVQIDSVVQAIGMALVVRLGLQVVLELEMQLTESTSNSCKNSLAAHPQTLLVVLKLVLGVMIKVLLLVTMSSRGNVVLPVPPLLGSVVAEMIVADMIRATLVQPGELHPGLGIVHTEATTVATLTMEDRTAMELLRRLRHGNKPPPIPRLVLRLADILATLHLDMVVATKETWVHLLDLLHHLD